MAERQVKSSLTKNSKARKLLPSYEVEGRESSYYTLKSNMTEVSLNLYGVASRRLRGLPLAHLVNKVPHHLMAFLCAISIMLVFPGCTHDTEIDSEDIHSFFDPDLKFTILYGGSSSPRLLERSVSTCRNPSSPLKCLPRI